MPSTRPRPYTPDPHHQELGPEFFDEVAPAVFPEAKLRFRNQRWAELIGLGALTETDWIGHFAQFKSLPQNLEKPLALRYHGHQFRSYNPDLGDGRGFLFAQFRDSQNRLLDLGTKGSGQTPWSRSGDGRLTLKGAVREVLATEMLEALGVNTSKTFSVIETGEKLTRYDEPSPTRSAVLVRLNHSHIRFGSFQRPAALGRVDLIEKLLRYSVAHYFPKIAGQFNLTHENWNSSNQTSGKSSSELVALAAAFLEEVTERTGSLCAQWMIAGFVHGVLNTDNMNITGESFDYGPYRFLPHFDPAFTAAYFDQTGLYAFGRQPESCIWNLEQLASCLALFIPDKEIEVDPEKATEPLRAALAKFITRFNAEFFELFCRRLGISAASLQRDVNTPAKFLQTAFDFLKSSQVGYDQFFFDWFGGELSAKRARAGSGADAYRSLAFEPFYSLLKTTSPRPGVEERLKDPYFKRQQPVSMLIDEIEAIWSKIARDDDWSDFQKKIEDVRMMGALYEFNKLQ